VRQGDNLIITFGVEYDNQSISCHTTDWLRADNELKEIHGFIR